MEPTFFAPRDIVISLEEDLAQKMIYKSYIKTVANIFINDRGSYVDDETLSQDALDVVNFEIELAKVVIEILTFGLILFRVLRFLFFSFHQYLVNPCTIISPKIFLTLRKIIFLLYPMTF